MDLKGKLRRGLHIFGDDNRDYGTIDRFDNDYAYVGERKIPVSVFDRMEGDRVYFGSQGRRYFETTDRRTTDRMADTGEVRVPVVEERLNVEKRSEDLGSVEIRKDVVTEQVNVPVELRREEVHVERRDVPDRPVAVGETANAFEEGTIRVPVHGERVMVDKEAVVTGEVMIDREQTTERQNVTDTVRKERVDVDENYQRDRSAFQEHFTNRRSGLGTAADTRKFEDVEPRYRAGYEAAHDKRYTGREFEDIEPELRREHAGSGSWEELREEVREGWNRARRS
jgi:uncharacterized protein (TIGR02271 family)